MNEQNVKDMNGFLKELMPTIRTSIFIANCPNAPYWKQIYQELADKYNINIRFIDKAYDRFGGPIEEHIGVYGDKKASWTTQELKDAIEKYEAEVRDRLISCIMEKTILQTMSVESLQKVWTIIKENRTSRFCPQMCETTSELQYE